MLHSFMIISGRGGIVLYRKVLTKTLQQPRLIAGLVAALCEFSINSLGQPAAHIELENATITIVEMPVDPLEKGREYLRAVLFHDTDDPDFYGHVLGFQLLEVFKNEFGERLLSMQLANVQGVEEIFRGFNAKVRPAIVDSVIPLMQSLEANEAVRHVFLVRHRGDSLFTKTLDKMWYSSAHAVGSAMLADLQALLAAGDDVLVSQADESSVVTVGEYIRIERLDLGTLVVVSQPPHTFNSCLQVIASSTRVLKKRRCFTVVSTFIVRGNGT